MTNIRNREKNWHLFPSMNATYHLTKRMNLRLTYARSIIRPDLRELAYFEEYDYELGGTYSTDLLRSTIIDHADFRYEWYPAPGEIFSLSLFFKKLAYPMEIFQLDNRIYKLRNDKDAENRGIEVEFRKSFAFTKVPVLRNITVYGNFTYLDAWVRPMEVDFLGTPEEPNVIHPVENIHPREKRPQAGASNYMYNGGVYYDDQYLSLSLSYNHMTNRTYRPYSEYASSLFERPLNSLDAQVAVRLYKKKVELKANVSNLLQNAGYVYQNYYLDLPGGIPVGYLPSKSALLYEEGKDLIDYENKPGRTYSFSVTYKF
jgi:outer membrane receptor protein involved in Fe transport